MSSQAAKKLPVQTVDRDPKDVSAPRSRNTVQVACKMPNGLVLRLFRMEDQIESSPAGAKTSKIAQPTGVSVKLNGTALPFGKFAECPMPSGYALTAVDADFWEQWLDQNKDSDLIKNRILFAADTQADAQSMAKENLQDKVKSGLEPIDPKNPPQVGMGLKVTTADKTA